MSKALFLFAKKVVQENIHFVRFEKQRMIFISSPRLPELSAVKLVSKSILARDFVPAMSITLNVMVERLENRNFDEQAKEYLSIYYQILSNIEQTLIIVENDGEGMSSLITMISGLVYDLGVSIEKVIPLIRIIDKDSEDLPDLSGDFKYLMPITGLAYNRIRDKTNLITCPVTHHLEEPVLMPNLDGERVFRTCARLFGPGSNSMKMYENTNNPETLELCSFLPYSDKEKTLEAMKHIIDSGGRNINSVLSKYATVPEKKLAAPEEPAVESPVSPAPRDDQEIPVVNLTAESEQETELSDAPEYLSASGFREIAVDEVVPVEVEETEQEIAEPSQAGSLEATPEQEIAVLPPSEVEGGIFDFASCLITTNASSHIAGHSSPYEIPDTDRIELHILAPDNNEIAFLINVGPLRVNEFVQSIRDISERVSGDILTRNNTVIFKTPENTFYTAYRGLIWSLIIEYISQIQLNVKRRTESLDFPNEGSIMLIPPGREYIRQKLPSQIMEIVEEDRIINEIETDRVQTVSKAIDTLLKRLVAPLRYGHGVALIPRKESHEMAEITLFLLLISEISGIGFSRW